MQDLVEDDLLVFDEEKEYDVKTDAGLKQMIADTVEQKSKDAITAFKDGLGSNASKLMGVLEKGGTVDDFIKLDQQVNFGEVALESNSGEQYEKNQQYLVEDWMKVQGYSKEEIDESISDFHENGMLRKQAELAQRKLTSHQKKQDQALMSQRETEKIAASEQAEGAAVAFKDTVTNTRDLAGFTVPEKKAKKLYDFTATKQARTFKKRMSNFKDTNASPKRSGGSVNRENQDTPDIPWLT